MFGALDSLYLVDSSSQAALLFDSGKPAMRCEKRTPCGTGGPRGPQGASCASHGLALAWRAGHLLVARKGVAPAGEWYLRLDMTVDLLAVSGRRLRLDRSAGTAITLAADRSSRRSGFEPLVEGELPADRDRVQSPSSEPSVSWPAPTHSGDLVGMLDRLAQTIVDALGFGVAVVNLAHQDGALEVVSVAGDDGARAALLGTVDSAAVWDKMLGASEAWGALRFIDHRNVAATENIFSWVPEVAVVSEEGAWHPEDALFAPLVATDGSRLGVLSVDLPRDGRRPSATTRRALEAFAVSAALAIEHATLRVRAEAAEARYKALATHDQLTGIANRSSIIDDINTAGGSVGSHSRLMALAFFDLDGFKQVNDVHSHAAGDHVLQVVAARLRDRLRPGDEVARWGGDEFVVLLRNLDSERDALTVLERLSAAVAEPIAYLGRQLQVTASVGVSVVGTSEEVGLDELVRRADAAMYQVKRGSRDTVAVHRPAQQLDTTREDDEHH